MPTRAQINKAIEEVRKQKVRNISDIARRYNIVPSTLNRHQNKVTLSTSDKAEHPNRLLTIAQEEALIEEINILALRGLYITPKILRNIVEELLGKQIGKNQIYKFVQQYLNRITSWYLKGYNCEYKIADNPQFIIYFYTNISFLSPQKPYKY